MKQLSLGLFAFLLLLYSCELTPREKRQYHGTWVGQYWETNQRYPLPYLYDFLPDGYVEIKQLNGRVEPYTVPWSINEKGIRMDTFDYAVPYIDDEKQEFILQTRRIHLKVKEAHLEADEVALSKLLFDTDWVNVRKEDGVSSLHFDEERVYWQMIDYAADKGKPKETDDLRHWKIVKHKDYAFLHINGNRRESNWHTYMVFQILSIDKQQLKLFHINPFYEGIQDFVAKPDLKGTVDKAAELNPFQLCSAFRASSSGSPIRIHEKPGSIANYYKKHINKLKDFSGFINLRFTINCNGDIGEFSVEGMNQNYQLTAVDATFSAKLETLTRKDGGWKPYEQEGQTVDTETFIVFKFDNGRLIDVSP